MRAASAVLILLLLAGCSEAPLPPSGSTTQAAASAAQAPEPTAARADPPPAAATTWFLHATPAGTSVVTGRQNCSPFRLHMDANDTEGDCDGTGSRDLLLDPVPGCAAFCFPADLPAGPYPAGTAAEGTIYVGTDAADQAALEVRLLAGGAEVGGVRQDPQLVTGPSGNYRAFPFSFATAAPVAANATLELRVTVHAQVGTLLGLDGDHASRFTLGQPTA